MSEVNTWGDVYRHVYMGHVPGARNGPPPETFAYRIRNMYAPDEVGGQRVYTAEEPRNFDIMGAGLERAVKEQRVGKATDVDGFSGSMMGSLDGFAYHKMDRIINYELN